MRRFVGVVVNNQHRQVVQRFKLSGSVVRRCVRQHAKRRCKVKRCALADFAVQPDATVHHVDELRGYCQPESRATELSRRRSIGLRERLEDQRLFVRSDADTRVFDREPDANGVTFAGFGRTRRSPLRHCR